MLMIPGFFTLSFWISRDIPGFIFYSNTYLLSLASMKFSSVNANIMLCFRSPVSEHLFQNNCFRTTVSDNCFRTTVSEQLFQNNCFRSHVSEKMFQNLYLIFDPIISVNKCYHDSKYSINYVQMMFT
jgi:hypothetical protein